MKEAITRRRFLGGCTMLAASASLLGRGCGTGGEEGGPPPPPGPAPVYELTDGRALYDDFEGNGNLQTFDGENLAVAGALGPKVWAPLAGVSVVESPAMDPGSPLPMHCMEISAGQTGYEYAWLSNPVITTFSEFRSLRADVCLAADATAVAPYAFLNFHTTIPEQPPGRSWGVLLGIIRDSLGRTFILGQYMNINLGLVVSDDLGPAQLDEWRSLRLDILTKKDAPALGDADIRLDYYVDGELMASRIPEDSAILIDPQRTGLGPHRSLMVTGEKGTGTIIGRFDNVRAVYQNRIA